MSNPKNVVEALSIVKQWPMVTPEKPHRSRDLKSVLKGSTIVGQK